MVQGDIADILITTQAIERRVGELGRELTSRLAGREPLVLAIMNGCVLFLADLLRRMPLGLDLEFVYCTSYRGTTPGDLEFSHRATLPAVVRGRHVLVVDDIFDTGRTLAHVVGQVRALGATEVTTAVLLAKRVQRDPALPRPDLVGFEIENVFAVGYGLDYNGRYRNLPFIGRLRDEITGGG
ncbi:MAG TPA: phosphoribosyltransferase family protein [Phycisphaerae bacterium]|nr:phosphoribosyltransferase family protein [Phycisphaerae bacterium]